MKSAAIKLYQRWKDGPSHLGLAGSEPFKGMPSWWVGLMACGLAAVFCRLSHRFFIWFVPYLREVFTNLKGLPTAWADLGAFWAERSLFWVAVLAAAYHVLWLLSTRYKLSSHDVRAESWFPCRKVTAVPLAAVRRVSFQQSLLGLALNYGRVEIDSGASSGPLVLLNCPWPKRFVSLLQPKVEASLQPHHAHSATQGEAH